MELEVRYACAMKEMPKVSVIVPIYNMGEYLPACLDSTLGQTLREIEVLCINDGSTDNTMEILRDYAARDARVRVVDRENWGVGKTRNQGIELATGEFVCFMDPDDLYPSEDVLEALYRGAVEHGVLICGGEFSQFSAENPTIRQNFGRDHQGYLFDKDGIVEYRDYQYDYGYHRFVYKRQWLVENDIFFPPYARFQDPPFFVKAMVTAGRFYAIDKNVYAYRTSHKVLQWNPVKANDMMCGMIDLLHYANKYDLPQLRRYTGIRFGYNYPRTKDKYDAQCKRTLMRLCKAYVQRSWKDYIYSQKKLWSDNLKLVTILGWTFIRERNK